MTTIQYDWIEQLPACSQDDLAAVEMSLLNFPGATTGRGASIRASLLQHRAALLGHWHAGASIPADVRFEDEFIAHRLDIAGRPAQCHAWAISDSHMVMAGGQGETPAKARARAMVGLMLDINEAAAGRVA
jgi:hypothetical protein